MALLIPVSTTECYLFVYPCRTLDQTKEKISLCGLGNKDAKVDMGIDVQKMLQDPVDNKQEVEARRKDMKKVIFVDT